MQNLLYYSGSRFPSIKNLYDTILRNSIHRKTSRCTGIKNTNKVYAHTRLIYARLPQFSRLTNKVNLKLYILTDSKQNLSYISITASIARIIVR